MLPLWEAKKAIFIPFLYCAGSVWPAFARAGSKFFQRLERLFYTIRFGDSMSEKTLLTAKIE
jgi:hypothetical protein